MIPKRKFQQGGKNKTGSETGVEVGPPDDELVTGDVIVVGEEAEAFNEEFTLISDKKEAEDPASSAQDVGTLTPDKKVDTPHEQ